MATFRRSAVFSNVFRIPVCALGMTSGTSARSVKRTGRSGDELRRGSADQNEVLDQQMAVEQPVIGHRIDYREVDCAAEHALHEVVGVGNGDVEVHVRECRAKAGQQRCRQHAGGSGHHSE